MLLRTAADRIPEFLSHALRIVGLPASTAVQHGWDRTRVRTHLEQNMTAARIALDDEDLAALDRVAARV